MLLFMSIHKRALQSAAVLSLLLPFGLSAQYAHTTNNGAITITKFTCANGPLVIPAAINGLPVRTIGTGAFKGCTGVTSVIIPGGVVSIETDAFRSCTALASLTIPGSVTSIGDGAFAQCSALKSLVVPDSVTTIAPFAFYSCTSLTNVSLPSTVTTLQNFAFGACSSLSSLVLPANLATVGPLALSGCANLGEITVPKSVKTIGAGAFSSNSKMQSIQVEAGSTTFSSVDGVLFDKNQLTLIQFPAGRTGSYSVPAGVTKVQDAAFKGANIQSVSLPVSISRLGDQAFNTCPNLKSLNFQGNAPVEGASLFVNSKIVTLYVTFSATGWGATYGGRPVQVLNPLLSVGTISSADRAVEFPFSINSATDQSYIIEACTDLLNPVWVSIGSAPTVLGSGTFVDLDRTNFPARFYRVRTP